MLRHPFMITSKEARDGKGRTSRARQGPQAEGRVGTETCPDAELVPGDGEAHGVANQNGEIGVGAQNIPGSFQVGPGTEPNGLGELENGVFGKSLHHSLPKPLVPFIEVPQIPAAVQENRTFPHALAELGGRERVDVAHVGGPR